MTSMTHVQLGTTGMPVSRLALGTATFGGQCDEELSFRILDYAHELGITLLDTADKYPLGSSFESAGISEAIVGRWVSSRKASVVIATKVHGPTGPHPWDQGLGRRHIREAVEASLRRLQVDAIDLYQLHRPDPSTPIEETLEVLTDLVREGKVRYVGCSNFLAYQVARALGRSEAKGLVSFASVQPRYNLLFRQHERELMPLCTEAGLGVLPYNLLAGGLLSGKHTRGLPPAASTRFASTGAAELYRERYWNDAAFDAVEQIAVEATDLGLTLPVLAAAWVLHQPVVTSAIVGVTRPEHLDAPYAALQVHLEPSALARLDLITRAFREGDAVQ
ncbi:MAG: aldo/keto reductase [Actinomycetota bacterium]|nr:aldo/keto reductase [Actinomycetota bacterium]